MLDYVVSLFSIPPESILIQGTYSIGMIAISVLIAIFSSFMGLQVAVQAATVTNPTRKRLMLLVGSIALGGGIWSMHFIGMLAFELCTAVEYGWLLTLLSLIPGTAASWVALNHIVNKPEGKLSLLLAGVLVGAGIGTMHYTGMAAMEMSSLLRYDLTIFALSIVVAVSLAILSLWIRFGLSKAFSRSFSELQLNLASAVVMGCAISGMHYTGMAAARFVRPPGFEFSNQPPETSLYLAVGVTVITLVILTLVLGLNLIFKYRDISNQAMRNEQRLSATMETAIDSIVVIDHHGEITRVNKATESLFGWHSDELIGKSINILIPKHLRTDQKGLMNRYLNTDEGSLVGRSQEVQALDKDGELVDVRLALGHVSHHGHDMFVAFMSDIRTRLKMERALRDNEARLRSLVKNIPGIVYRCRDDDDWGMIFVSDAVERITGYDVSQFLLPNPKVTFSQVIHPEDLPKIKSDIKSSDNFNIEYRILRKDGEVRWVLEFGSRIYDPDSDEVWIDGFIMDITERYQMVEELKQAKDKAENAAATRATFLANMSHEIRTPMNAIIGFSDILLESTLDNNQKKQLNTINNSAKSLLYLLNDILDSAKLDKGKLELEQRNFSLIEEVDAVVSTLWIQAKNKGLLLETKVHNDIQPFYLGAPERIRQVLTNLVNNAIKFTRHGEVIVSISPLTNEHIEFVISDTGIGMSQEQLSRIFEPFTQADESMSRRFGGTGLGTTISKQLVELMGGKISASSKKGQGSIFRFVLPLTPAKEITNQRAAKLSLPPMKILVVDDISQNVELLDELLSRMGHEVIIARDGQQALIRMEQCAEIDVVLMDVQMPVLDGLSAAKRWREYEKNNGLKHLPIVALTASVLEDDRLAAQNAGMDGFANKPVEIQALLAEISNVTGHAPNPNVSSAMSKRDTNSANPFGALSKLGVDTKSALTLWGTQEKYIAQLKQFISEQQAAFDKLDELLTKNQAIELRTELHKLKGLSGNLSLTRLMELFQKAENLIAEKAMLPEVKAVGDQIQITFKQLADCYISKENLAPASDGIRTVDASNVTMQSTLLTNELKETLQRVQKAAQNNEIDEEGLQLLESMEAGQHQVFTKPIINALNDFEFEDANQKISEILITIQESH